MDRMCHPSLCCTANAPVHGHRSLPVLGLCVVPLRLAPLPLELQRLRRQEVRLRQALAAVLPHESYHCLPHPVRRGGRVRRRGGRITFKLPARSCLDEVDAWPPQENTVLLWWRAAPGDPRPPVPLVHVYGCARVAGREVAALRLLPVLLGLCLARALRVEARELGLWQVAARHLLGSLPFACGGGEPGGTRRSAGDAGEVAMLYRALSCVSLLQQQSYERPAVQTRGCRLPAHLKPISSPMLARTHRPWCTSPPPPVAGPP